MSDFADSLVTHYSLWDLTPFAGALDVLDADGVSLGLAALGLIATALPAFDFIQSARRGSARSRTVGMVAGASFAFGFIFYVTVMSTAGFDVAELMASLGSKYWIWYLPLFTCLLSASMGIAASRNKAMLVLLAAFFAEIGFFCALLCAYLFALFSNDKIISWAVAGLFLLLVLLVSPAISALHSLFFSPDWDFEAEGFTGEPVAVALRSSCVVLVVAVAAAQMAVVPLMNSPAWFTVRGETGDSERPIAERSFNVMMVTYELRYFDADGELLDRFAYENDVDGSLVGYEQYGPTKDASGEDGEELLFVASRNWRSLGELVREVRESGYSHDAKALVDEGTSIRCERWRRGDADDGWRVFYYGEVDGAWHNTSKVYYEDDLSIYETIKYSYGESGRPESLVTTDGEGDVIDTGSYRYGARGDEYINIYDPDGAPLYTEIYRADGTEDKVDGEVRP